MNFLSKRVLRMLAASAVMASAACTIGPSSDFVDDRQVFQPEPPPPPFIPTFPPTGTRRVKILHTNDEHSHLFGFAPQSDYPFTVDDAGEVDAAAIIGRLATTTDTQTVGGLVRRQYLINRLRAESTDPVLLLSGGDVMMGTLFHAATAQAAPDYLAMAILGYDFATFGNHEFDFGPAVLAASLHTVNETTFGGGVPIIASNIHFDDVGPTSSALALQALMGEGDSGAPIMPWATKVLPNGLKVGFMGLVGYDAALVAPAKAPIVFSTPTGGALDTCTAATADTDCPGLPQCVRGFCVDPLDALSHLAALAADAQAVVQTLRLQEGVDLVVAMTHLGNQEDQFLAANTSGIDVIIGGHSHELIAPYKVGNTIITQAGSYGRWLGELTITVAPDGEVDFVAAESEQHDIDGTLDVEILGDTDLINGVPSVELERALTVTGAVIGPVVAGLNAQLGPILGANFLDPVVSSDHDVGGERAFEDSPLLQLVTDASWNIVVAGTCSTPGQVVPGEKFIVATQANGVVRDSLRFSPQTSTTSLADVFSVLPLGGSPLETTQIPGYPIVMFDLNPVELYVGLEVGVTNGLQADSFFLGHSGVRVTYDESMPPFNPAGIAATGPNGRITKIEMIAPGPSGVPITVYEYNDVVPWIARWSNLDPQNDTVTVITNLYLAGFLDAFGLHALDPATGLPYTPIPQLGSMAVLGQTFLCQTGAPAGCGGGPAIAPCFTMSGGTVPWPAAFVEVKEWGALLKYLTQGLGGTIPTPFYNEATFQPRVIDATP